MRWATLLLGWMACTTTDGQGGTDPLDDSFGDVSGQWTVDGEAVDFSGGIAYSGAFGFEGRAVLALTSWDDPSCAGSPDAWFGVADGFKLEVPFDGNGAAEDAKLFDCEALEGTGFSCATVATRNARVTVDESGLERGDVVRGTVELLDALGQVEATLAFDVTYCGSDA